MAINPQVKEALKQAQQFGEVFLARMDKEEIEKTGFDVSTFGPFRFVEVYLLWDGEEFLLKYLFDGRDDQYYYEKAKHVGGHENLIAIVESYIQQNHLPEDIGTATVKLVGAYPLGPNKGAIYIYQVMPHPVDYGMHIQTFYICTFDDDNTEVPWGMGSTPREAIEHAIPHWAKYSDDGDENPFKVLYDELYRSKEGE